jgi:protein gp37
MGDRTGIEWTDATWNPVTGCTKVSLGCKHCYARRQFPRVYGARRFEDVRVHPERLDQPIRWARPRRIFVNSMSDLFHEDVPVAFLDEVFEVMAATPRHRFQILTKRPSLALAYIRRANWGLDQLSHVWFGVSVEDQQTANERIPLLLAMPTALRFLSVEPLLGPVRLRMLETGKSALGEQLYLDALTGAWTAESTATMTEQPLAPATEHPSRGEVMRRVVAAPPAPLPSSLPAVDWVIVGGESGPRARAMAPAWPRSLRDECSSADVPFFFKQWGEWAPADQVPDEIRGLGGSARHTMVAGHRLTRFGKSKAGRLLDGRTWDELPAEWQEARA